MSVDVFVFIRDNNLPNQQQWQAGLDALGIDLLISDVGDMGTHTGFWPVTFRGSATGFEFHMGSVNDLLGDAAPSGLGDRDLAIDLVTGARMLELVCSLYAAAGLAYVADGVCWDASTTAAVSYQKMLEEARRAEASS